MMNPMTTMEEDLLTALECPVCFESSVPLYMCMRGHNVCSDCRQRLDKCAVCNVPGIPAFHNIVLDTISERVLMVACRNKAYGCLVKRRTQESLEVHYDSCEYGYKCDTGNCRFIGTRSTLNNHMETNHSEYIMGPRQRFFLLFKGEGSSTSILLKWEDHQQECFWFCSGYDPVKEQYYFYARYIGPSNLANKFMISIMLKSSDLRTMIVSSLKEPLQLNEDFVSHKNVLVFGKGCFPQVEGVDTKVFVSLEPIVIQ